LAHRLPGDGKSGEGLIVANYLYRRITASNEITLPVYLGSNDGIQVWFNGRKVLAKNVGRTAGPDQDIIKLHFRKGSNTFLMKVNNRAAAHAFYFSMHPGDGLKAEHCRELWRLIERDFPNETEQRQMRWERRDNIWPDDCNGPDLARLAGRYAKATASVGNLAQQVQQLAPAVRDWSELRKVRELYYLSKRYSELISRVEQKIETMARFFAYLNRKYPQLKRNSVEWQKRQGSFVRLRQSMEGILAQAGKGDSSAFDQLAQLETKLEELHRALLAQVPEPAKRPQCAPFDLSEVRLLDGPFKRAMELDRNYLHELDSDRLLHMFRVTAGLPSSAEPLGGWEKRGLRGHTMGHYLSACALMYASTGDEELKAKANALVGELAKCQKAIGNGYLGAFPEEGINRVIYGRGNWWAPWYTFHKILAGLIDMYNYCDNQQALEIAKGMAAWAKKRLDDLNFEQSQRMLEVEFGGMNEALCNLYAITKDPDHLLTGRRYYYDIATFFWDQVVNARSYCTGGTSNHEHWRTEPYKLATELGPATQETCCTYNMLKLTRHIFCWSAEAKVADYYERALYNSILSTQDPRTGMMMYFVPLGSGYWKLFNTPYDSFWCCTGTGIENHAKYGDSIYFHDERGVYINLFIASELHWKDMGVTIRQETNFPEEQKTTLVIETNKPTDFTLRIRIPYWIAGEPIVKIGGRTEEVSTTPSSYLELKRRWNGGDTVEVSLPMKLHPAPLPDEATVAAIMYGPLVMAGELGSKGLTDEMQYAEDPGVLQNVTPGAASVFTADINDLESWIKPVAGRVLTFRTINAGKPKDVTLIPFYKLFGQRYAIYWHIEPVRGKGN